ncbi:MAG: N-acetylmuramoyl-L-alanine amidase, partial [Candidatus Omnitrophica bacterium]|nr:N-acetylmuramoyl-L-alanine amidase [Candidatus Omnitrophota bacterium]
FTLKDLNHLEKNETQRMANHRLFFNHVSMQKNDKNLEEILADMLYSHKQYASQKLADQIASQMVRSTKGRFRGNKNARFYVLRNTLVPSVLVEVGFLSNPKEEKLLIDRGYQQKIAQGIAEGIIKHAKNP